MTKIPTFRELHESGMALTPLTKKGIKDKYAKIPFLRDWQLQGIGVEELSKHESFGAICGIVGGGLECLDFDSKVKEGVYEQWIEKVPKDLLDKLPVDKTQNGGYHVWFRSPSPAGNLKLAYPLKPRTVINHETGKEEEQHDAFIETRGTGGQAVVPPSPGYETIKGSLINIPFITTDERNLLIDTAKSFDETVVLAEPIRIAAQASEQSSRPGDDFNLRGTWSEILTPHGWKFLRKDSRGIEHWERPGKNERMTSATINTFGFLVVFSSSTLFNPWNATQNNAYSKFSAYTLLNHGSDFKAAAADLRAKGYGKEEERPERKEKDTALDLLLKDLVNLEDMSEPEPLTWIWQNFIAKESATLISARGKGGKTTLLAHLLRSMASNQPTFLNKAIVPTKMLIISEEGGNRWWRRNNLLKNSFGKFVKVNQKRPQTKPSKQEWPAYCEGLAQYCVENGYGVIVFDTMSKLFPIDDENNNAQLDSALTPIYAFPNNKIAVVVIHHANKYGQGYNSTRGGTAINAFFDILVRIDIHGNEETSNVRKIFVEGRDEVERESFLAELKDKNTDNERYEFAGGVQQTELEKAKESVMALLELEKEDGGEGLGVEQIQKRSEQKLTQASIYIATRELEKAGVIISIKKDRGRKVFLINPEF